MHTHRYHELKKAIEKEEKFGKNKNNKKFIRLWIIYTYLLHLSNLLIFLKSSQLISTQRYK